MEKRVFGFLHIKWELVRNKPFIDFLQFIVYFEKNSIYFLIWKEQICVVGKHHRFKNIWSELEVVYIEKEKERSLNGSLWNTLFHSFVVCFFAEYDVSCCLSSFETTGDACQICRKFLIFLSKIFWSAVSKALDRSIKTPIVYLLGSKDSQIWSTSCSRAWSVKWLFWNRIVLDKVFSNYLSSSVINYALIARVF